MRGHRNLSDSHINFSVTLRDFTARRAHKLLAFPAVFPPPGVQRPAGWTNKVHGAGEQIGEHPGASQDSGSQRDIEQATRHCPWALAERTASMNFRALATTTSSAPSWRTFTFTSSPPTATAAAPALINCGVV